MAAQWLACFLVGFQVGAAALQGQLLDVAEDELDVIAAYYRLQARCALAQPRSGPARSCCSPHAHAQGGSRALTWRVRVELRLPADC